MIPDITSLVEAIFADPRGINQVKSEVITMLEYLVDYKIHTYLEIGTEKGGTMRLFSNFMPEGSIAISMDIKESSFFMPNNRTNYFLTADSQSPEATILLEGILQDKKLDLLFIDGSHTIADKDFERYSKYVRPEGFVVFHDINPNGPAHNVGTVPQYWKTIKDKYESMEIISGNSDGFGIGIIKMP